MIILGTQPLWQGWRQDLGLQAGKVILTEPQIPHLSDGETPCTFQGPGEKSM